MTVRQMAAMVCVACGVIGRRAWTAESARRAGSHPRRRCSAGADWGSSEGGRPDAARRCPERVATIVAGASRDVRANAHAVASLARTRASGVTSCVSPMALLNVLTALIMAAISSAPVTSSSEQPAPSAMAR